MSKLSVNELTDETGSGAPSFPNGVSVTGAALTDPEITGGIYLGGTGSANYLDDYEEGTWTPTDASGTGLTFTLNNVNWYVKLGNLVTISFDFSFPSTSSGNTARINLPFTMLSSSRSGGIVNWSDSGNNDAIHFSPHAFTFQFNGNTARTCAELSGNRFIATATYQTSS